MLETWAKCFNDVTGNGIPKTEGPAKAKGLAELKLESETQAV